MATATEILESASDQPAFSNENDYHEVLDGLPVEKPYMGAEADRIMVILLKLIEAFSDGKLGLCFSGHCGYQKIFPTDPKRLRFPDVSFVRAGRLPGDKPPRGNMEIVPDLIAEIISPNDNAEDVEQRLTDFLVAGVPLAWLIYPQTKQVYVFRQGPAAFRLGIGDVLDGEDVLPGFSCPVKQLFAGI